MPSELLTGQEETCVLIDGTIRRVPVAVIEVDTPFIKGQVRAVCMRNPLYDLIIGNVLNVTQSSDVVCQAAMTRQQAKSQSAVTKSLNVSAQLDLCVGREESVATDRRIIEKCMEAS